jgi:hypothetical protein
MDGLLSWQGRHEHCEGIGYIAKILGLFTYSGVPHFLFPRMSACRRERSKLEQTHCIVEEAENRDRNSGDACPLSNVSVATACEGPVHDFPQARDPCVDLLPIFLALPSHGSTSKELAPAAVSF